jgi:hypothetical protein
MTISRAVEKVIFLMEIGGEIGIRTLGTVTGTPHFECGAFDHSAISPQIQEAGHYRKIGAPLRQSGAIN